MAILQAPGRKGALPGSRQSFGGLLFRLEENKQILKEIICEAVSVLSRLLSVCKQGKGVVMAWTCTGQRLCRQGQGLERGSVGEAEGRIAQAPSPTPARAQHC